ncbi:MAG: permease [Rhodospirillaceae bacterium]|nr:permease [Rhodospirillaceae bacterium]
MTDAALDIADRIRKFDRVVLASLVLVLSIVVFFPQQLGASLRFAGSALLFITPFILLSVVAAGVAKATSVDQQVARVMSGNTTTVITFAALFGALSPFCSCGVIPLIAALLAAGVPLAPVAAFWIASPLMSIEKYVLASAIFDPAFASIYLATAVVAGLGAGFATHWVRNRAPFQNVLRDGVVSGCAVSALKKDAPVVWPFWRETDRRQVFNDTAISSGAFLFKWLTLAFLIESLMVAWLPAETIGQVLGGDSWWTVPASTAVGIPAYLNGFAALSLVSRLVEMGAAPAAALAFLTAGAVTSFPAAMGVYALVKKPVFFWYIGLGLFFSLAAGFAYQIILG